jgi:hypothetical protein
MSSEIDIDRDPRDEIAELEADIEEFAATLERCRKIGLAAKAAMVLGAVLLPASLVWFDPVMMIGGLAALLGGVVAFGSNSSTASQTAEALQKAEALRAALIGRLNIRLVHDASRTLH